MPKKKMADQRVRTSLNISQALLKQAKHVAVEEERPFGTLVADALTQYLKGRARGEK